MIGWTYLGTLVLGLACMVATDRRWRLVLWADALRGALVLGAGMAVFVGWDLAALHLDLYGPGESAAMTGVEAAPSLPVEELFFIGFLCYLSLVLHRLLHMLLATRPAGRGRRLRRPTAEPAGRRARP
jgi:lycopene cyclase domain-containing protein